MNEMINARELAEKTIAERDRLRKLSRGSGNEPAEFQLAEALIKVLNDTDELARRLYNLICLKDHKDAHGKTEVYKRNQPEVWAAARSAVDAHRIQMGEMGLRPVIPSVRYQPAAQTLETIQELERLARK